MARTSLILLRRRTLVRLDLAGTKVDGVWQRPRPDGVDSATAVDAALRQGPKRRADVVVLGTEFWTGAVPLPADVAGMVAETGLDQTLAFEAEAFSGLPAFESTVAHRPMPLLAGETRHWVTQLLTYDRDAIEQAVRQWGGKLVGVGHPASIAAPADVRGRWRRIEHWDDVTLLARGDGGRCDSFELLSGDPRSSMLQRDIDAWLDSDPLRGDRSIDFVLRWGLEEAAPSRTSFAADDPRSAVEPQDLAEPTALERWGRGYLAGLRSSDGAPLLKPPVRPMATNTKLTLAAVLSLLAIAGCWGHHLWVKQELATLSAKTDALVEERTGFETRNKGIATLEQQRDSLAADLAARQQRLAGAVALLDVQQSRWNRLLAALEELRDPALVIEKIDRDGNATRLIGHALDDQVCDRFVSRLGQKLAEAGWLVRPAGLHLEGRVYAFEISLIDLTVGAPKPVPAREANDLSSRGVDVGAVHLGRADVRPGGPGHSLRRSFDVADTGPRLGEEPGARRGDVGPVRPRSVALR